MQENATRPEEEASEPSPNGAAQGSDGDGMAGGIPADWRVTSSTPLSDLSSAGEGIAPASQEDWQARAEDYLGKWQRMAADMANMRRRHEIDRLEYMKQSNASLLRDLLQVLDSFDYALASTPEDLRQTAWVDGVAQVERQLRSILERNGLTAIEAQGQPFDPALHEALMQEESDQPEGTVIGELQRGYKLHDRVLRPSMVKVAK